MKSKVRIRVNRMYDTVAAIDSLYERYAAINDIGYLDMLLFYEILEDDEPYTQKRMCDVLEISKTTLNAVVKRWIQKEYIELVPSKLSGREKWIRLTDAGAGFAHRLIDPLFKMEEKAVKQVTDEEIETMESIVAKYADSLERQIEKKGKRK